MTADLENLPGDGFDEPAEPDQESGHGPAFWQFWTTLPGVLAALATLTTAAAALLGLFVQHQTEALNERDRELVEVRAQPTPTVTVTVTATPPADPGVGPGVSDGSGLDTPVSDVPGGVLLAELEPVSAYSWPDLDSVTLSSTRYPRSVVLGCGDAGSNYQVTYDVHGRTGFTAQVGIPDNEGEAGGAAADVTFYDEDGVKLGKTVTVTVGRPKPVELDLTGVVQFKIVCVGRDRESGAERYFNVALGDARISS